MFNTSKYSPLSPDIARAIYNRVYNRNDDVMHVYNSMFASIFSGGIAVRTSADSAKKELRKLNDEEEENFLEFLKEAMKWIDMFGMVPFRKSRASKHTRVIVPDFNSGQFVACLDEDLRLDIGWKTYSNALAGGTDQYPDEDVFVYIISRPSNMSFPYVSTFGSLLQRLDLASEMRQNYIRANHDASAPPLALGMQVQRASMMNTGGEADHFRDVADAAARNRSLRAQQESRYSMDRAVDDIQQMEESEKNGQWTSPREVCLDDGRRVVVDRGVGYLQRRMLLPANRQPTNVQLPAYNPNWMSEESFSTDRIYSIMRWPNPSNSRNARQKMGTSGVKFSEADQELESMTVKMKRDMMRKVFRFVYRHIFRENENQVLEKKKNEAQRKVYETLNLIPSGHEVLSNYLKWMTDHNLQFEHPYIRAQYEFQKNQERIEIDDAVEMMAQKIVAEAMGKGEVLETEIVTRHLRIMMHERESIQAYEEKLESNEDRTELIFLQDSMEDSEMVMSMVESGLIAPREASKFLLIGAGTEEKKAENLSKDATGLSPVDKEKIELEKQKIVLENKKLSLEKEKAKTEAEDKKEKNKISMISAKTKPEPSAVGSPKKKPKNK